MRLTLPLLALLAVAPLGCGKKKEAVVEETPVAKNEGPRIPKPSTTIKREPKTSDTKTTEPKKEPPKNDDGKVNDPKIGGGVGDIVIKPRPKLDPERPPLIKDVDPFPKGPNPMMPPMPGGNPNPNPMPMPGIQPKQPGQIIANPPMPPRNAIGKLATLSELKNLHLFIDTASLASNKMPTPQEIYEAAKQADPLLFKSLDNGAIVLTGAQQREGVWAFDASALQNGGRVVTNQGVENMTAQQLKTALGR